MKMFRDHMWKDAGTFKVLFLSFASVWVIFIMGCHNKTSDAVPSTDSNPTIATKNMLLKISKDNLGGLKWMNPPAHIEFKDSALIVTAIGQTDFFINPADMNMSASAPFLYKEVRGDFVAKARVTPDMSSQWNAAALMVILDETHWIKFGFENSDATGPGIVSVVTRGTSDDANGPVLENTKSIWLKLVRKGHNYSMHWSPDGSEYFMARLAAMPEKEIIRVGIEAQCPDGSEAIHRFDHFSIESISVEDLRKGE